MGVREGGGKGGTVRGEEKEDGLVEAAPPLKGSDLTPRRCGGRNDPLCESIFNPSEDPPEDAGGGCVRARGAGGEQERVEGAQPALERGRLLRVRQVGIAAAAIALAALAAANQRGEGAREHALYGRCRRAWRGGLILLTGESGGGG